MNHVFGRQIGPATMVVVLLTGCRDLSSFSTHGGAYQGPVVQADFVRAGVTSNVNLCMTIDTNHLQDGPGNISSSDGFFNDTPLRAIPQIWQDPLSTLTFGEGRAKNLIYVATSQPDSGTGSDVLVVVSLMDSGNVEVRLLRGAPTSTPEAGATALGTNIFAVFTLTRQTAPCLF